MGFAPVLAGVGLAGAGLSALGAYNQNEANAAYANYQAQVARNNAIIAGQNAAWAASTGAAKEAAIGMQTRAQVGSMKAKQGAAGVDVNTGSAAAVTESAREIGELNQGTSQSNTAKEVYGYQVQEEGDVAQAQLEETEAHNYNEAAPIAGLGTFLSGASGVGAKFASMQNTGGNSLNLNVAGS